MTGFQCEPCRHFSPTLGVPWGAQEDLLPQATPQDEPMPTKPEYHTAARPFKSSLAGSSHPPPQPALSSHCHPQAEQCSSISTVIFRECYHLGSSLGPNLDDQPCRRLAITCVHGHVIEVPTTEIQIQH